jgi:hypothetical protein
MFNVYKNQLSRQTGSRNLTGPKTLPTIWHTYMKLVTKYQISAQGLGKKKLESKEWIFLSDWLTQITVLNIERENQGTAIKGKLTTKLNYMYLNTTNIWPRDWEGHVPCTIGTSKSIVAHWGPLSQKYYWKCF